ncbi:TetR family transcriptional regulator [Amycolatopsis antarctica]|uniref:TetR family transcriptional regulator n=1 Tax=Amycolatopsis antarctica TaxID=1854586 RepID=A0A263D2X5_9PSEU|nr:TetR/AcrR family transcriptional regulator [Amycolatopsis antarctica]OZM72428.1 TetR family transcriptional regulator [Amycolatopsis antarctica]
MPAEARTWGGTTLADRRSARRQRLLEAGLDLLGGGEDGPVSVRAVCRRTGLTERYFYESFADRDELVLAVYERIGALAHHALAEAVAEPGPPGEPGVRARAEAAVRAFVELIVDDPRAGRVLLLAPLTEPALTRRGAELAPAFATLVLAQLPDRPGDQDREMTAIALVGALTNLFVAYLDGRLDVTRGRLVAHCVRLVVGANSLHT